MRSASKLLVVASMVCLSSSARATKMASVVRGAGAGSDKAAAFVSYYARYFLANDGRYDVIDLGQVLGTAEAEAAKKAFADAEQLTQKAQAAYESLELDPAVQYLNDALDKYEKNAGQVTDTKKIAETLMLLGAVHILRGEEKAGADKLVQALIAYPGIEPDPRVFNPQMRQIFQRASNAQQNRSQGSMALASSPSYAEVFVDGVFRGVTPMTLEKVRDGRHWVRLVRDGYKPWGGIVTVGPGKQASETGALRPLKKLDECDKQVEAAEKAMRDADPEDDSAPGAVEDLGELLSADQLFLAEVRLDGERVKVLATQYDLKAKKRLKTATQVFSYDSKGDAFEREVSDLLRTQFGETTLAKKRSATKKDEGAGDPGQGGGTGGCDAGCQHTRTLALAFGLGGGAVLGGLGGLFDFFAARDNETYRSTAGPAQNSQESAALRSSGQRKALLGDILVPLGVVALGVGLGTYLFYGGDEPAATSSAGVTVVPLTDGGYVATQIPF